MIMENKTCSKLITFFIGMHSSIPVRIYWVATTSMTLDPAPLRWWLPIYCWLLGLYSNHMSHWLGGMHIEVNPPPRTISFWGLGAMHSSFTRKFWSPKFRACDLPDFFDIWKSETDVLQNRTYGGPPTFGGPANCTTVTQWFFLRDVDPKSFRRRVGLVRCDVALRPAWPWKRVERPRSCDLLDPQISVHSSRVSTPKMSRYNTIWYNMQGFDGVFNIGRDCFWAMGVSSWTQKKARTKNRPSSYYCGSEMFREHVCTWPNDIVLVSRWNNLETRSTNVLLSIMLPSASTSAVGSPFCLGHFCISNKFVKVMFKILRHLPSGKRKNSLQTGKPPFFGVNQLFRLGHFQ